MKKKLLLFSILLNAVIAMGQVHTKTDTPLSAKEKAILSISAFTAQGNTVRLAFALQEGLNAGLTINEIKEMLVQLYAYAGFPRSLNALNTLMAVLEQRKTRGIQDVVGEEPAAREDKGSLLDIGTENQTALVGSKVSGPVYTFAPAIDRFLKEHLFGAIFSRRNLDWKTREWVTIAALAAMEGNEQQLRSHFGVGLYNGLTVSQLTALVQVIGTDIDPRRGEVAKQVMQSVLDKKPYTPDPLSRNGIFASGQKIQNDNFSGTAWLNQLVLPDSSNTLQVGNVLFEPGARTKWHYHPSGQILVIIEGLGYYQEKGMPKRLLRKGDVVKCPPNLPHWHGAAPNEKLVQLAITDSKNGTAVWLHAVSEEEYHQVPDK